MTEVLLREDDENRVSRSFDAAGIKFPPFFWEIRMAEPEETKEKTAVPKTVWVLGMVSLLMDISSEMIHALLPLFMVQTLNAGAF